MLAVFAAVVLGGVALMFVAAGREVDRQLESEVERVERDLDRDFGTIRRDVRRELDRRLGPPEAPR
jgi:sensor domain CHASE-containing protein